MDEADDLHFHEPHPNGACDENESFELPVPQHANFGPRRPPLFVDVVVVLFLNKLLGKNPTLVIRK